MRIHHHAAALTLIFSVSAALAQTRDGIPESRKSPQEQKAWKTNFDKRSVNLGSIMSGGPPKDGIPAINNPRFDSVEEAGTWLRPNEPVISVRVGNRVRAYPLQVLIWHEIVNDRINGRPVAVTFCPLCYSAIAFDRRLGGSVLEFGVSGMLRHSDMIMFDRQTESWWQQFSGEAIVGDLTGKKLTQIPAQIVSFEQFAKAFPFGFVLSRETGYKRAYGRNPYLGYDNVNRRPFLYRGKTDSRLPPMEKVVAIEINGSFKAYPYKLTRNKGVIHDRFSSTDIVVFHGDGAASALDASTINRSREVGSTGVFEASVNGRKLEFTYEKGEFFDKQTGSRWNIFGHAVGGKLKGNVLKRIPSGDYFAFAWLVFRPQTEIYR